MFAIGIYTGVEAAIPEHKEISILDCEDKSLIGVRYFAVGEASHDPSTVVLINFEPQAQHCTVVPLDKVLEVSERLLSYAKS